jgi:hypothetical protein
MGGVACLLILFPKLLIENEKAAFFLGPNKDKINSTNEHTEDQNDVDDNDKVVHKSEYSNTHISGPRNTLLDESLFGVLESEYSEAPDAGCVGLLLSIVAHCLAYHKTYQRYYHFFSQYYYYY